MTVTGPAAFDAKARPQRLQPRVHKITKRQLNRGANAVADVAGAIKAASKRLGGNDGPCPRDSHS